MHIRRETFVMVMTAYDFSGGSNHIDVLFDLLNKTPRIKAGFH